MSDIIKNKTKLNVEKIKTKTNEHFETKNTIDHFSKVMEMLYIIWVGLESMYFGIKNSVASFVTFAFAVSDQSVLIDNQFLPDKPKLIFLWISLLQCVCR